MKRYTTLSCNASKNAFVPVLLLIFSTLRWKVLLGILQRSAGESYYRNILSFCFCHRVFGSPVLLASVVNVLSGSLAKSAKQGISVTNFCLTSKSSSSLLVHFDYISSLNNRPIRSIFSESQGRNFAIYCIARRKIFKSLLDVRDFICRMVFTFFPVKFFLHLLSISTSLFF